MAHLRAKARFALRFATAALGQWKWSDDELFLRVAYNSLLKRESDCEGLEHYNSALRGERPRAGGCSTASSGRKSTE